MPSDDRQRDLGWLSLLLGLASAAWAIAIVLPSWSQLPAWPAASVGAIAIAAGRLPGRALPRGLGSFLGLIGLIVGAAKIAALWGLLSI